MAEHVRELSGRIRVMANFRDRAEEWEENGWIARARMGDPSAYQWLLDRYRARVVRLASHVLRRPSEAEDVAQDAFIRAFRSLDSYRGDGRFYTWLYHIVLRICLDRRRLARWDREISQYEDSQSGEVACGSSRCLQESSDPRILVESLMKQLNPAMRAALVLRELEGMEYEEIALTLRIPVGTVRSRLHAARAQFRELWTAVQEEAARV